MVPPTAPSWTDQVTAVSLNPVAVAMKDCDPPSGTVAVDGLMVMDIVAATGGAAELFPGGTADVLPPPQEVSRNGATRERPNIKLVENQRCFREWALTARPPVFMVSRQSRTKTATPGNELLQPARRAVGEHNYLGAPCDSIHRRSPLGQILSTANALIYRRIGS